MRDPAAPSGRLAAALIACAALALGGQAQAEEAAGEDAAGEDAAAQAAPEEPEAAPADAAPEDDVPSGETPPRALDMATVYVGDHIFVPLRSGPSSEHRIVNRGVGTGTPLQATGIEQDGFVQVHLLDGSEAWLEEQFVSRERVAREQLEEALGELESLRQRLSGRSPEDADNVRLARELDAAAENLAAAEAEATALRDRIAGLEEEAGVLRALPAARLRDEVQSLEADRERMDQQNRQLEARLIALEGSQEFRWMLIGAGLLLGGLILGVLIKSRPPRRGAWP